METKQNDTGKMSRTQKVIVVVTAVTLAVILILMFTTRFMGSGNTYPIGDSQENSSTQTTAPSESPEETEPDALSETDQPESGLAFGSVPNTPTVPELPGGLSPELPSGTGNTTPTVPDHTEEEPSSEPQQPETPSEEPPEPEGGNTETPPEEPEESEPPEEQPGNVFDGASVSLTDINESTVSFQIGSETVTIPVQTTIFNGRVTKSGVLSDSLQGYSIGASVMLYYPEGSSLNGITLSGAYVKADSSRLTVSGDYNGDGSKIVFRLNGVKLP